MTGSSPRLVIITAATAPVNAATEPTDRSMCPMTITSSIPRTITMM